MDVTQETLEAVLKDVELEEAKLTKLAAQTEARWLEKIMEGWSSIDSDPPIHTANRPLRKVPHNSLATDVRAFAYADQNESGAYHPYYMTDQDVLRNLEACRNLLTFDAVSIGLVESLRSYILGGEVTYRLWDKSAGKSVSTPLSEACNAVVSQFLDYNGWHQSLCEELFVSSHVDGESFVSLYPVTGQNIACELKLPEQVRTPQNPQNLEAWMGECAGWWTFGVHCRPAEWLPQQPDRARPCGYHVIYDLGGRNFEYLPAWPQPNMLDDARCMYHVKRNAPLRAARGVSDFWPVLEDLERAWKIWRNTGEGAALQAAIAGIIRRQNSSKAGAFRDIVGNAIATVEAMRARGGTLTTYARTYNPGTIIETDAGSEYTTGPMGSDNSSNYIEVGQFGMRRSGTRWQCPEAFVTGDASNNNFASMLVAESPFVKRCEYQQLKWRYAHEQILLRVLRIAQHHGWLPFSWEQVRANIGFETTFPEVATRDAMLRTSRLEVLHRNGVITREKWAELEDFPADEVASMEEVPPQWTSGASASGGNIGNDPMPSARRSAETWREYWRGYP